MEAVFLTFLFVMGACSGSFICCQARRLRLRSRKGKRRQLGSRSVCLYCHRQLKWYDNLPILSWLYLRGRCRYCHHQIGAAEFISELVFALSWLALGTTINVTGSDPLTWTIFIAMLIFTLPLGLLAIYDGLYGELPTKYLYLALVLSIIILPLQQTTVIISIGFSPALILHPLGAALILGGLYLLLYLISHGRWVGDGDWLLALSLAIALGNAWLALVTLFLANILACLWALPTLKRSRQIHLGPFLVVAFIITYCLAGPLLGFIS